MKVLLLGGTGAMGVSLVQILAQKQNEVYVTTRKERISKGNVHYIKGNAHDISFLKEILKDEYDAIVDFMVYTSDEFRNRIDLLLSSTKQYMFLSSSRVYADTGDNRITENSPRLLDVCTDVEYLATNEYALAKAREENILFESAFKNWTIIRPYITYNNERLQLGVFEKESWLSRALDGQTIVFPNDIAQKTTTLTYGYDVAKIMSDLIGNKKALGEAFHIATEQTIEWKEVLDIYLDVIETELGYRPRVYMPKNSNEIGEVLRCRYQISCDRLFHRSFSNKKISGILENEVSYTDVRDGLSKCLRNFIRGEREFLGYSVRANAYFDKLTRDSISLNKLKTIKQKVAYLLIRYTDIKI